MSEQQPKIPPSLEVIRQQAIDDSAMQLEKYRGKDENFENIRNRAKDTAGHLGNIAKRQIFADLGWATPHEGADYLGDNHDDHQYTINRVKELLGNPSDDEEFERLLEEYVSRVEASPNGENFEERMPHTVYMQGQRQRLMLTDELLHDEDGMFVLRDRRSDVAKLRSTTKPLRHADGTIRLHVTKIQAEMLRSFEERRARIAQDEKFKDI